jgi:AP2 domain
MKGVSWHKPGKKWLARINVWGKRIILRYFDDLEEAGLTYEEAGLTYDAAAKMIWSPRFQRLNFQANESDHIVLSDLSSG